MIVKVTRKSGDTEVSLELDSARDSARIEDEARKLNILERDRVTTNVIFKLISHLAENLIGDCTNA